MHSTRIFVLALLVVIRTSGGAEPVPVQPADFKLVIERFGVQKEPLGTAELVVHRGRAFHFVSGADLEVIVFEPSTARLELVDLDHKTRSDVSLKKLDTFVEKLHGAIATANAKRDARGGKANQVAAAMSRDLIDPHFTANYDTSAHRLRLTNRSVEVEARGEAESDQPRLALIAQMLTALAKLESLRDPQGIPPFARLEVLEAMTAGHRLRPAELTFLYRLAGPPRKFRWTYRLEPKLTEREVEAGH